MNVYLIKCKTDTSTADFLVTAEHAGAARDRFQDVARRFAIAGELYSIETAPKGIVIDVTVAMEYTPRLRVYSRD